MIFKDRATKICHRQAAVGIRMYVCHRKTNEHVVSLYYCTNDYYPCIIWYKCLLYLTYIQRSEDLETLAITYEVGLALRDQDLKEYCLHL